MLGLLLNLPIHLHGAVLNCLSARKALPLLFARSRPHPFNRRLAGPHCWSGLCREEKNSVSMSWCRAHSGTCDQILLPVGMLLSEICLGSRRSKLLYDWRSVSQSVSMFWYRAPLWDFRRDITSCRNVAVWKSKSKLLYDWRSVSQYVLVSSTLLGLATRYYFLSECCCLKFAVLFLWGALSDERTGLQFAVQSLNGLVGLATRYYFLSEGCCLKFAVLFLWDALSDERTGLQFAMQWSESRRTRNHTLLSHLRLLGETVPADLREG
jgi:hypothetical protein